MICDVCGHEVDNVIVRVDPYLKEVCDQIVERALCERCYEDRLDDV